MAKRAKKANSKKPSDKAGKYVCPACGSDNTVELHRNEQLYNGMIIVRIRTQCHNCNNVFMVRTQDEQKRQRAIA